MERHPFAGRDFLAGDEIVRGRELALRAVEITKDDASFPPVAHDPGIPQRQGGHDAEAHLPEEPLEFLLREVRVFLEDFGLPVGAIVLSQDELRRQAERQAEAPPSFCGRIELLEREAGLRMELPELAPETAEERSGAAARGNLAGIAVVRRQVEQNVAVSRRDEVANDEHSVAAEHAGLSVE